MDFLYEDTIALVNSNLLGIIDVVDNEITLRSSYDANVVAYAGSTRLEVTEHAVAQCQCHGIGEIHARQALHAGTLYIHNIG